MSLGYSINDVISLTRTAWNVVQNSRKACGEYDELTREVSSLHVVLKRLEQETAKPECPVNKPGHSYGEELVFIASQCHRKLKALDQVLEKYNALSEEERSGRKLWQKFRFGNGQMADLADYRSRVGYYTSIMSTWLNMIAIGTMGSVEKQMNDAGGDLKEIKEAVNGIAAHLIAKDRSEGSVLTAYSDDDKAIWKELRRELVADGFSSSVIGKHKHLIKAYIKELGSRGLLDDADPQAMNEPTAQDPSIIEDASQLVAFKDADTADSQVSATRTAEGKGRCIQTTAETSPDSLLALWVQSNADRSSILDSTSDIEPQIQPKEEHVVAALSATSVTKTQEDFDHTTYAKPIRQSPSLETLSKKNQSIQYSIGSSSTGTQVPNASTFPLLLKEGFLANSKGAYAKVEAAIQATNEINQDNDPFLDNTFPDSPAEMLSVVFNAWFNEYLLTWQCPNIAPSIGAKKTLRILLSKLYAVNLDAIGWSNELKACRISLIKQLNLRLGTLRKGSQTPRKHHVCDPRCFWRPNASNNAKSIRDIERKLLGLSTETHDGAPPKNSTSWLSIPRGHQILGALHQIWHDHHDGVAPLCIKWAQLLGQGILRQDKFQKRPPMSVELMEVTKYIESMRRNKELLEPLDFYGDAELTACRQLLMDDIKLMVSSIRIFKSDARWRWETLDLRTKSKGQRLIGDISWLKITVTCSMGTKCRLCPAT